MSLNSIPFDLMSHIIKPLNVLDISNLAQTSKRYDRIISILSFEQQKRRLYEYRNLILLNHVKYVFGSKDMIHLNSHERDRILGFYVDRKVPNSFEMYSKLVYLNMPEEVALQLLTVPLTVIINRMVNVFDAHVKVGGYDYVGLSLDRTGSEMYMRNLTILASFHPTTALFQICKAASSGFRKKYKMEKREFWLTSCDNNVVLWMHMSRIRMLKAMSNEEKYRWFQETLIEGLGKKLEICPVML